MAQDPISIEVGSLRMDRLRFEVTVQDAPVWLTRREFELLWLLASHSSRIFHRDEIVERVWGDDYAIHPRAVDVVVTRIRRKLRAAAPQFSYVATVWGIGYCVNMPEVLPCPILTDSEHDCGR